MMPVIVYGIGSMGIGTASLLINNDCEIICFLDKGVKEKTNIEICGKVFPVFYPDNAPSEYQKYEVLISMSAAPVYEVREYLNALGFRNVAPAGDALKRMIPSLALTNVWSLSEKQFEKMSRIEWEDEVSQLHWKIACEWFLNRSEDTIKECSFRPDREKYLIPLITERLKKNAVMIDSAYLNGEYSDKFIKLTNGRSYAFKLHPETVVETENNNSVFVDDHELYSKRAELVHKRFGFMEPFVSDEEYNVTTLSIDEFCAENSISPDFIRIYSMSETLDIVLGACDTIKTYHPVIAVNIGHYFTDFITVPTFLKNYCDDYEFYFRIHSFQGNDCILYARCVK